MPSELEEEYTIFFQRQLELNTVKVHIETLTFIRFGGLAGGGLFRYLKFREESAQNGLQTREAFSFFSCLSRRS